ncbi:putative collagen-binding protein [Clostridium sp. CAG:762]|nr:putative collagen-binding protein [Clostridium sp. CAG:762]
MKKIKKTLSLLLLLVLSLAQVGNVKADGTKGTITIKNAIVNETYSIYRILDLETYDAQNNHYIYRANTKWEAFINDASKGGKYLEAKNENGNTYYVWKENADQVKFTEEAIAYAKAKPIETEASKKATSTTVQFTELDLGYYLVSSSVGSLLHLTTTNPNGEINEKNTIKPEVDKEVKENSTGVYGKENDATIGDTVEFKSTITTGAGFKDYVLYDKMSTGLTLNPGSIKAYVIDNNDEVAIDEQYYTVNENVAGYTFTVTFDNEFIAKQPRNTKIVVKYTATLNENATIEGTGNTNETNLKYGNDTTETKKTTTYTYKFNLKKTDADENEIKGAEFKLYKDNKEILVVLENEADSIYRVAVAGETGVTIKVGHATIKGLDAGTYYLEEVVSPEGYNKLTSKQKVEVKGKNTDNSFHINDISVVNYTGSLLPETGGIGTMLFITFGLILILGFGLLLVTKLRAYKANI